MGENSKIEWTDHTFNPWRGCTKVSEGCKHCYAETLSNRFDGKHGIWGPKGTRVIASESGWKDPLKWNKEAGERMDRVGDSMFATGEMIREQGRRARVFCASLADVFEGSETMSAEAWLDVCRARDRLFSLIESTPNLDWLLLTKRPEKVMEYVPVRWYPLGSFPDNIWIGTSIEDQKTADERIPHLLQIPAKVRFLSCEPLLGSVDITAIRRTRAEGFMRPLDGRFNTINWVICGGESGPNARPMQLGWAQSLRDQCEAAGVAFFMKQLGKNPLGDDAHDGLMPWPTSDGKGHNIEEFPPSLRTRQFPEVRAQQ